MIDPTIHGEVRKFLQACRTACLATVDDGGLPHAANVQYATDEQMRLYFISSPTSAHSRHVAERRNVAMTVYSHDDTQPGLLRGVQLHGRCEQVTAGEDWDLALAIYSRRFPFVMQEPFASLIRLQAFYRVTPTWLRWIDNRRGFGFKASWEPGSDQPTSA